MEEGGALTAKVPGELMAHHYIKFTTMIALITAPSHASLPNLIMLLGTPHQCNMHRRQMQHHMPQAHTPSQRMHRPATVCAAKSQEFANIVLRRSEKKTLNAINHALERVRFFVPSAARPQKPKERIQEPAEKIFILVRSPAQEWHVAWLGSALLSARTLGCLLFTQQASTLRLIRRRSLRMQVNEALSDNPSDSLDYSMRQEVDRVLKAGARIAACMCKCARAAGGRGGRPPDPGRAEGVQPRRLYAHKRMLAATSNALLLHKCLKQRMWDNTRFECRQARHPAAAPRPPRSAPLQRTPHACQAAPCQPHLRSARTCDNVIASQIRLQICAP